MKTTIIISLLCLGAMTSFAQNEYTTKDTPPLINNGPRVYVTPAFDVPYKVVSDNPCYMYKKHGLVVLECPGILFIPQGVTTDVPSTVSVEGDGTITVQSSSTYTGNYPKTYKVDFTVPANATPVYPKGPYTPLVQGPPCYEYTTPKGLVVMECPGAWFPPEHKDK